MNLNKYDLTISKIQNLKIRDWDRLKAYTSRDLSFLPSFRNYRSYEDGCQLDNHQPTDMFVQFKISFCKNESKIIVKFWKANGRQKWQFENFYECELKSEEINCQNNAIRYLNHLIDEGILAFK